MKFPSDRAEQLYQEDPSDQVGSSSDLGWAGLYARGPNQGGVILVEYPDGHVSEFIYEDDQDMRASWGTFERTLEIRSPGEEDARLYDLLEEVILLYPTDENEIKGLPPEWVTYGFRFDTLSDAMIYCKTALGLEEAWVWKSHVWYLRDLRELSLD